MSRQRDLNPRPSLYKSVALPLSYVGKFCPLCIICNFIRELELEQGLLMVKNNKYLPPGKEYFIKCLRKDKFSALLIRHWLIFFPKLQLGRLCTLPRQNTKTTSSSRKGIPQKCRSREKLIQPIPISKSIHSIFPDL